MVYASDLKSDARLGRAGSTPAEATMGWCDFFKAIGLTDFMWSLWKLLRKKL